MYVFLSTKSSDYICICIATSNLNILQKHGILLLSHRRLECFTHCITFAVIMLRKMISSINITLTSSTGGLAIHHYFTNAHKIKA